VGKRRDEYNPDPIRYSDMRPGCYDPAERARDMLADGIYGSVRAFTAAAQSCC